MTDKPQVEEETAPRLEGNSSASLFFVQMPKLLASAPIVLAILGICYDVGFFAGIGLELFPLFTLSEHLVFAMEAVPVLMVLIAAFMWLGFFLFSWAYTPNAGAVMPKFPFSFLFRPTEFVVQKVSAGVSASSKLAASKLTEFFKGWAMGSVFLNVGVPAGMLLLAFGLGYLQSSWPGTGEARSTIMLNDGPPISGRVLRAGERGLLVFNALDGTVQFRPWAEIKRIEVKNDERPQ